MPTQLDAYIDPDTGDLPAIARFTTGIELIQQRIRRRLRRGVGEWFLDPQGTGLPLIEWRERKPPDIRGIVGRVQQEIREVPGVVATANFEGVHDPAARRLTVSGDVIVDTGEVTAVVVTGVTEQAHNAMVFGVYFSSGRIPGGIPR
ncbi:MAG TPA: hypothetical protein VFW27_15350, partial [Actinoplanes sp.]|nr:hypothetical protein [Actinoplanes sp.]